MTLWPVYKKVSKKFITIGKISSKIIIKTTSRNEQSYKLSDWLSANNWSWFEQLCLPARGQQDKKLRDGIFTNFLDYKLQVFFQSIWSEIKCNMSFCLSQWLNHILWIRLASIIRPRLEHENWLVGILLHDNRSNITSKYILFILIFGNF